MTKSYNIIEGGTWEIETHARPFGKKNADGTTSSAHVIVPVEWQGATVRVRRTVNNENKPTVTKEA